VSRIGVKSPSDGRFTDGWSGYGVVGLTIAVVVVVWYIVIELFLKGFVMAKVVKHTSPERYRWALGSGTAKTSKRVTGRRAEILKYAYLKHTGGIARKAR